MIASAAKTAVYTFYMQYDDFVLNSLRPSCIVYDIFTSIMYEKAANYSFLLRDKYDGFV